MYCEYADGAGGPAGTVALTKQALAAVPDDEDVLIDIGGSADCGVAGPGGAVASIVVPEGFYNVHASFAFFARSHHDERKALRPIDTPRGAASPRPAGYPRPGAVMASLRSLSRPVHSAHVSPFPPSPSGREPGRPRISD